MRVFDFDNTIYNGESVFDFYLFSIKKNPKVIKYLFVVVYNLLKYKAGKTTMNDLEEAVKKYAIDYLTAFDSYDELVNEFWDSHIHKIKKWYKPQSDDVIMTASLNLIMDELCRRLGVKNLVCTTVNRETLEVEYINFGKNKCDAFREKFPDESIDEFYTDNIADMPMIEAAEKGYIMSGNKIKQVK